MKTLPLIQPKDLQDQLPDFFLLDVRSPAEFEEVHIPGSRLAPLQELQPDKIDTGGRPCVLICRSGNRARQAAEKFAHHPGTETAVLEGGVAAWEAAGLPVQRGRKTISIERQVRIGAGALVLLGVILGLLFHPLFLALSGFVGAGLIFAGVTDWCGMGLLLARMPWNNRGGESARCNLA